MKHRLDTLLVDRGLVEAKSKTAGLIMAGDVMVNGKVVTKAGTAVDEDSEITIKENFPYVSRAASKLMAALDHFEVDLTGCVGLDIGASTGGFTDLMLSRGASRVYAVDVGHGQLHWKLRNDERVISFEGVNARTLDPELIPESCDICTFDLSFISLKLVVPKTFVFLKPSSRIIALIKPQFEASRDQVGKGGIVRDERVTRSVLDDIEAFFISEGLDVTGIIPSPVKGTKGNQEYLIHAFYRGTK